MKLAVFFAAAIFFSAQLGLSSGYGLNSSLLRPRPNVEQATEFARWLVASATWGVLNTVDQFGLPFGYVASFSDAGTGIPYFYLSSLDPAGKNLMTDSRASFTISEAEFGTCTDPQSPTCGKITLSGDVVRLDQSSEEAELAMAALFAAHPLFNAFPTTNGTFSVFKTEITRIYLVNKSAPPRDVTVGGYLAA